MTRAESAIINTLKADSDDSTALSSKPCLLWTVDNHTKGADIGRLSTHGERTHHKVPEWISTAQYRE
jgi:hypothetical protein